MNYILSFFQKISSQIQGFFTFLLFHYKKFITFLLFHYNKFITFLLFHYKKFVTFLLFQYEKYLQNSVIWQIFLKIFLFFLEKIILFLIYFLYYFNFIQLFYLKALRTKGYIFPVLFIEFLKLHLKLFKIPLFVYFCNPENTFFIHLIITQILMQKKIPLINNLIRFHIITLTLLDSLYRLAVDYVTVFVTRHVVKSLPLKLATTINMNIFYISISLYIYSFICGLFGLYPNFPPPFDSITKSAYFWLRIKKKEEKKKHFKKN